MGVKDLWTILTPYCERKPIYDLKGKVVAVDLAGWVCESLNVVDYFVHPRQYLKNLFFRTCYLLLEGVIPIFVLEGTAPKLKAQVISKRNELQFRGVKPRNPLSSDAQNDKSSKECKGRTRFNHVLKQCEMLLQSMGLQCVQGPGEAEAYCAFLNKEGLVEGVISQDSDCFAYGALKVYRNFSVSTQGNNSAQGGAVDVYDMLKIKQLIDFGQNKIIVMALLCGCDYCPDGVGGVGRDSVLKLFAKYKNDEILERIKLWRSIDNNFTALEMRANDNNICSNCGHLGKTQTHTRSGCGTCHTIKGCDASLWRDERNSIRAELALRQKALSNPEFPSIDVIDEFLSQPESPPKLNLEWRQPNLIKFIRKVGNLLQWTEIYCLQKFLPLLTRWQILNYTKIDRPFGYILPKFIKKKRTLKGVACYEIVWNDEKQFFNGLVPEEQFQAYIDENPTGLEALWSTIEPQNFVEKAYPEMVKIFLESKQKKSKPKKASNSAKGRKKNNVDVVKSDSLQDMSAILEATEEIEKKITKKSNKIEKGIQKIDKFLIRKNSTPLLKKILCSTNCSTPKSDSFLSNLDSDDEDGFDFSGIIQTITSKPAPLQKYAGKKLKYVDINTRSLLNKTKDDMALLPSKRNISIISPVKSSKKPCLNNSLEIMNTSRILCKTLSEPDLKSAATEKTDLPMLNSFVSFGEYEKYMEINCDQQSNHNVSYFFTNICDGIDEFEKSVELSFLKN